MFLHNDKELFQEVIVSAAEDLGLVVPIVEKDYYVTMILKKLSIWCPECVFKGGTSLSKCHHIIDRFSEDIDISFSIGLASFPIEFAFSSDTENALQNCLNPTV